MLSYLPIQKWDEKTNLAIVSNTLSVQHFPLLYIDDRPFFEKPPLWYWVTLIATNHSSDVTMVGRMISALCGFMTIVLTTYLAWRWWGSIAGLSTWIVLITTNHFFMTNPAGSFSTHTLKSADLDSMHILFLMISFASLTHTSKIAAITAGIAAGLSTLTKSPLGLLPLIIATLIYSNKRVSHALILAWIATIATILPWYLWMITQFHIPFLASHFGYHMVARIQYALEGHEKSIWYYAKVLSERRFFMSWEWLLGSLVFIYVQRLYTNQIVKFTTVLAVAAYIIPTIISTKLAWYLLPFYPFAALVMGFATSKFIHKIIAHNSPTTL